MREDIIKLTETALSEIKEPRFFKSERGYQGAFYCKLLNEFENRGLTVENSILEMEYQKTDSLHGTSQRPDIIFHIPIEHSGDGDRTKNNFAVWAFKLKADEKKAQEDFTKLNSMFESLNYSLGFFINLNKKEHYLDSYKGDFKDRLVVFSVCLQEDGILNIIRGKQPASPILSCFYIFHIQFQPISGSVTRKITRH